MMLLFIIGIAVLIVIVFRLHTSRTPFTERFVTNSADTLTSPNFITANQELVSRNKQFSAGIDGERGELVIKDSGDILWRVGPMSDEQVSRRAQFKIDLSLSVTDNGNIVLWYGRPGGMTNQYWTSNTTASRPRPPYKLAMQDDRNLVLYDGASKVTWSSGTNIAITSWKSPRCLQANECVYDTTNKYRACHLPDGGFAVQDASGSDTVWSSRPKRAGEWKLRDFGPRTCPPGTRHDTSSGNCWADSYGRGVGELPSKPLSFEHGGAGTPWLKRKARPTATPKLKRKARSDIGRAKGSYGRGVGKAMTFNSKAQLACRDSNYPEEDAGLCYKRCNDGYEGIGPVCWQRECKADEVEIGGLCFDKCPDGYRPRGDMTACWKNECEPDEEEKTLGLCYKKCDPGWKDTPDLTACWKDGCEPDEEKSGLLCYPRCPEGSSRVLNRCWRNNPCKEGQEKWGGLCYPKCKDGYRPRGCCICEPKGGPGVVAYETHCKPDEYYQGNKCAYFQVTERPPIEGSSKTCLQEDGNLVSYDNAGKPYWSSGSMQATPNGPYEGKITKERVFAVTDADGQEIWKTDTLLPDATDEFAVPRDTDMPGVGACTARAGNKGQCCAGIMCKGGALFDYCSTCYTPDGRPSVNGCYGYGPDSMWLNPAFETCKGCTMLDGGRRMGCWCSQSTDPLSPPWRTQWTEISLDPDKMVQCTGPQGNRVLNNVDGELKLECSKSAAKKKDRDKWVDTKGFTDFVQMALDPGGEADRRIRTAKLFDKNTTMYLPKADHSPSYKVTPIMRKGQNGDPCWWVNAAGRTTNECRMCYDDKGQPSDACPVKDMYGECAGCTWDGNTLGCWCLTGRDMYSTEWRTLTKDATYAKIDSSAAYVPVATSSWDRRLQWVYSLAGSKVPLGNGQTACVAHDKNAQCKAVDGKPASIKCDFGDGQDSPEYEVPPACRDSKTYPTANVRIDRDANPDSYRCDTSGYLDTSSTSDWSWGIVSKCQL